MTPSEFLYKRLNPIAKTFPLNAPEAQKDNYIVYSIDSVEQTLTTSGVGYSENFVTITAYGDEYDSTNSIASEIIAVLGCSAELNIMGATFSNKTIDYVNEPVDKHSVALEFSIFER